MSLTPEQLKEFEDYWAAKVCNKRGLDREAVITHLLEYKKLLDEREAWENTPVEACYIEHRARLTQYQHTFDIILPDGHYNCGYLEPTEQLALNPNKPIPQEWHQIIISGIKEILTKEQKSIMVTKNE